MQYARCNWIILIKFRLVVLTQFSYLPFTCNNYNLNELRPIKPLWVPLLLIYSMNTKNDFILIFICNRQGKHLNCISSLRSHFGFDVRFLFFYCCFDLFLMFSFDFCIFFLIFILMKKKCFYLHLKLNLKIDRLI